jgi:hypothetical protein
MTIILSNDSAVAIFSFLCSIIAFIAACWYIPETLPDQMWNGPNDFQAIEER